MRIPITRQVQIDLYAYNAGIRNARRAYAEHLNTLDEPRTPSKPPPPCGTSAAYKRHYRNGEKPCETCRATKRADDRARYQRRKNAA